MLIILTQVLLFGGVIVAIWMASTALKGVGAMAKAVESTFAQADKHITDLANNDAILAEAIDKIIESLDLDENEVYQD